MANNTLGGRTYEKIRNDLKHTVMEGREWVVLARKQLSGGRSEAQAGNGWATSHLSVGLRRLSLPMVLTSFPEP